MRRVLSYVGILVVPLLLLATPLAGAPKADKDKDLDKTSDKMVQAGLITGKVMNVYEDKKKLRIQITYVNPKVNQGAVNALNQAKVSYAQAQQAYAVAYAKRDGNGMAQAQQSMQSAMRQIATQQASLITYEEKTQDMEVQAADDVVVRSANPPEQFDDKGKVKKYTKKELDELKGPDRKLPGYKAEFGDIQTEMLVKVQLVKKKDAPKPLVRKGKDKDADLDVTGEYEPQASLIIILHNPAAAPPGK